MSGAYRNEQYVYIAQDGHTINLHDPPRFVVVSDEGTGIPPLEIVTQRAPFQHGETRRSMHLNPRVVRLVVRQNGCDRNDYWDLRDALIRSLRPNRRSPTATTDPISQGGVLRKIFRDGRKRDLNALISEGPKFEPRETDRWDELAINESLYFVAHNPIYYDPSQQTFVLTPVGVATFPMTFPVTFLQYVDEQTLTYDGDWNEYPTITITGPFKHPSIENETTGETISLNTTIPSGMSATIDLTVGAKKVTRSDGLDLTATASGDLATFHFEEGANILKASGDNGNASTLVTFAYYNRYLGL